MTPMPSADGGLVFLNCQQRPDRIGFTKHILEGYDNLALLSTIDSARGWLRITFHQARHDEVLALLCALDVSIIDFG